jgi:GntR family transcriptional repressor for pyruvate dehydrogenase complex
MMAEKFGVSRGNLREAIQKLEFYGLLKSIPQSGTFVANIGVIALNGMIDDILQLKEPDFKSLVETRILLELKSVRLASLRRSEQDLMQIEAALKAYSEKVMKGEDAVQEDLLFHLAIANASGNSTLNTFMLKITPEIITNFEKYHVCDANQAFMGIDEHQAVFDAIVKQDPGLAKQKMKEHFKALYQYCYNT